MSEEEERKTSEWADVLAASSHAGALQLELRGPGGKVIPTEDIDIRDMELFIPEIHGDKEADKHIVLTEEQQATVDAILEDYDSLPEPEPWHPEPEISRYQISVTLQNEWDIP